MLPTTYVNSPESHVRVINCPDSISGVIVIQSVTLNRPDKLNAITLNMIQDLMALFETFAVDERVKVVILTGAGHTFSARIDLRMDTSQMKNSSPLSEMRDPGGSLALAMFNCCKPVIVAYNGLSVGIGMTSTLAAGIRNAPHKASFGFPFSRIGITMESCSSYFLPRMVGYSNAKYPLTTGETYLAESSVLHGIFAELVSEPKEALPRAIEFAANIAGSVSLMAVHINRQLMWRNPGSIEGAHIVDSRLLYDMFGGRDHL